MFRYIYLFLFCFVILSCSCAKKAEFAIPDEVKKQDILARSKRTPEENKIEDKRTEIARKMAGYAIKEDWENAIRWQKEEIKQFGGNDDLDLHLAYLLEKAGKKDEAKKILERIANSKSDMAASAKRVLAYKFK